MQASKERPRSAPLLVVKGLQVCYGKIQALKDVSLEVHPGEVVALLGGNGAGKSTLFKSISGICTPTNGEITFDGRSIVGLSPHRIVRLGLSHVPERRRLFAPMTVMDNLDLGGYCLTSADRRRTLQASLGRAFASFPVLKTRSKQQAGTLSGGEQQMLAVSRSLMSRPKLLLLDEPSIGLAPMLVKEIMSVVANLREQGCTILLAEQNARAALKVADRGYVLDRGEVVIAGTADELIGNAAVQVAYLGKHT